MSELFEKRPDQKCDAPEVESLLAKMSLTKPSSTLDSRIATGRFSPRPTSSPWFGLACGLAGILIGFWMGRHEVSDEASSSSLSSYFASDFDDRWIEGNIETGDDEPRRESGQMATSRGKPNTQKSVTANTPMEYSEQMKLSDVRVVDQGVFLLNGAIPVRKYRTVSNRRIRVVDPETGDPVDMIVPVERTVVAPNYGT